MSRRDWIRLALMMSPTVLAFAIAMAKVFRQRRATQTLLARIEARPARLVDGAAWEAANPTPLALPHWWIRTRPDRRGFQIDGQGQPPCVEFYVPWWARLLDRLSAAWKGR